MAYGGRGGSKSWGFARALLLDGAERTLRILCTREIQNSIKDSVHQLLIDQIDALGLEGFYNHTKSEIRGANGTLITFSGLSKLTNTSIKSFEGYDRVWVEEAQTVSRRSWDILIPTIRKEGSEIWATFNPELDSDETYQRFVISPPESAKVVSINWKDNHWFPAVLDEERKEFLRQVRDQEDYNNIWEGQCREVVEGAIWGKELIRLKKEKRLSNVPYDPLLKVHCVWDLGWNDQTAILMVQRAASEIRIIDYIEDSHRTVIDYVNSEEGREDLASRSYNWGDDWLPHDGYSRNVLSKKNAYDYLKAAGRAPRVKENSVPNESVETGIDAARLLLPRVYIDEAKAGLLFNRLSRYKRRINQRTNQPMTPEHDENSHGSDGFRYLALVADKLTNETASSNYQPYRDWE